ncbi:MAG: DNA alkylation repair protein [Saprospiraceae bacterium]|nr:DNA alkylation repair protein [Saprospiraceae bacterium]
MTAESILQELQHMGTEQTKKTFMRHGAQEPFFGVKVGDMKTIVKRVKKDHALSLALYDSGNSDAMYLAGLIADEKKISKSDLQHWAEKAYWYMISEYTVAWVASESPYGWELALEWIESDREQIATAGWATLSNLCTIKPDSALDQDHLRRLLDRVAKTIHQSPNRVRYTMNGFVVSCGICVVPLSDYAIGIAEKIGTVHVDVGDTSCQVPLATGYIQKAKEKGKLGHKKKMARC